MVYSSSPVSIFLFTILLFSLCVDLILFYRSPHSEAIFLFNFFLSVSFFHLFFAIYWLLLLFLCIDYASHINDAEVISPVSLVLAMNVKVLLCCAVRLQINQDRFLKFRDLGSTLSKHVKTSNSISCSSS